MPPVTRNQLKKVGERHKPYSENNSKQNGPLTKRTALLDIPNNDILVITKNTNEKRITNVKQICEILKSNVTKPPVSSCSNTNNAPFDISKESELYKTTSEELNCSDELYHTAINITQNSTSSEFYSTVEQLSVNCNEEEIFEIDKINWNNFMYVGCYARDIFNYLKQREDQYIITDYINNQSEITRRHRAIVVDWLVSLQDIFELNHEVLYMAVKLIDLYLMKHDTLKNKFQLLAAGALLLSSKIEIRQPGLPQDLCKEMNYTEEELIITERKLAISLNFDINVPLSYVFLRRYARCMKCQMVQLTLARYVLECSLLEYNFVTTKESLKAASSLYLAFKMNCKSVDENEFHKFTGYTLEQLKNTVIQLNNVLHTQSPDLSAIKQKYMHEAFYRVANKPLLSHSKLTFK